MKIQIDGELYLTGSYALTGDLNNSIEMSALPDDEIMFYPAYKILSKKEDSVVITYEPKEKTRTTKMPVFDEDGNETGEYTEIPETYTENEPVETPVSVIVYYYELDEAKKAKIQYTIDNPEPTVDHRANLQERFDKLNLDIKRQDSNIDFIALLSGIDI